jgi:uncharacterized protein
MPADLPHPSHPEPLTLDAPPATPTWPGVGAPDAAGPAGWAVGSLVLWRFRRAGRIGHVQTARVAADERDWLALYWAEGYPRIDSVIADGRELKRVPVPDRYLLPRVHRQGIWYGAGSRVLCLVPRSSGTARPAYSVWMMWDGDLPACYYINLEAPHELWDHDDYHGLDTEDYELDLIVSPDRARWRLKDEAEFVVATGLPGYWSDTEATQIRSEGERALARVLSGEPPLDRWAYRPDPSWTVPGMPASWEQRR